MNMFISYVIKYDLTNTHIIAIQIAALCMLTTLFLCSLTTNIVLIFFICLFFSMHLYYLSICKAYVIVFSIFKLTRLRSLADLCVNDNSKTKWWWKARCSLHGWLNICAEEPTVRVFQCIWGVWQTPRYCWVTVLWFHITFMASFSTLFHRNCWQCAFFWYKNWN